MQTRNFIPSFPEKQLEPDRLLLVESKDDNAEGLLGVSARKVGLKDGEQAGLLLDVVVEDLDGCGEQKLLRQPLNESSNEGKTYSAQPDEWQPAWPNRR